MPDSAADIPLTVLLYTEEQRGSLLVESQVIGMISDVSGADKLIAIHDPYNRITFLYRIDHRSDEHTSELQSLMRISYAVFCLINTNATANEQLCTSSNIR